MSNITRKESPETLQERIVFNDSLNDQGVLFGGRALMWMDEVAYLTASKFSSQRFVTVAVEKVKFRHPIKPGTRIRIIGEVVNFGNVKLTIEVKIRIDLPEDQPVNAVIGHYILAPIGDNGNPEKLKTN